MTAVVFYGVPAWGHVNPTLGVVRELVRRGHRVAYHCGEPHRSAIEATGAEFRAYEPHWIQNDMPHDGDVLGLARIVLAAEQRIVPVLLPEARDDPPDVIVHDSLAPWGKTIAASVAVPAVCSTTTFVFDRRVAFSRPRLLAGVVARQAKHPAGVRDVPALLEAITSREAVNLVYTSRAFQPFGYEYDDRFVFVGPILRDEPPLEPELAALGSPIYVTLGTLFNDRPALFRAIAGALAGLGHPVVISTGGRLDPGSLAPLPSGVVARSWVSQLALLRGAALAVTHAGMNSVNEALFFDVPLVLLPQAADQTWVARRVVELGAGIALDDPSVPRIRDAARHALADPAIRGAATRLGASLRSAGGGTLAADTIVRTSRSARPAPC